MRQAGNDRGEIGCLAFRRRIGAEPGCRDRAILAHEAECAACAGFARAGQALERRLHAALTVPVPEQLAARVIWRQVSRRRRPRLALAAGVLLAAALGLLVPYRLPPAPAGLLPADVIAHIRHEPALLALPMRVRVAPAQVRRVLTSAGVESADPFPDAMHAGLCLFHDRLVPHLVIEVAGEAVSVLLFPDETVTAPREIHVDGYEGILVPHGRGSMAIVAPRPELITPARQRFAHLRWTGV